MKRHVSDQPKESEPRNAARSESVVRMSMLIEAEDQGNDWCSSHDKQSFSELRDVFLFCFRSVILLEPSFRELLLVTSGK